MNKQQEINILEEMVSNLGDDGYTGPWLKDQLPFIKMAIESDLSPDHRAHTYSEMMELKKSMVNEAERNAEVIMTRAKDTAAMIEAQAHKSVRKLKDEAVSKLQDIIRLLQ